MIKLVTLGSNDPCVVISMSPVEARVLYDILALNFAKHSMETEPGPLLTALAESPTVQNVPATLRRNI